MTLRIDGLGNLQRRLQELSEKIEGVAEVNSVPLAEVMNPEFMAACSRFASLEEMFAASGFKIESAEDFKAIPDDEWNVFIRKNTNFTDWAEMQSQAGSVWMRKKLGL